MAMECYQSEGLEIMNQLNTENILFVPKKEPLSNVFSKPCKSCSGTGTYRKKIIKLVDTIVTCNKCTDGCVSVPCNNCLNGWSETGPCKTCGATGKYTYYPTKKYPEGKVCKYCLGYAQVVKKVPIEVAPSVKCFKCKGTGKIQQNHHNIFNPVIKKEDVELIHLVDNMVDELFKETPALL